MKKNFLKVFFFLTSLLLCMPAFCQEPLKIEKKPEAELKEPRLPVEMPFYVFNNSIYPPQKNFAPSGYMGDIQDIKLTGSYKVKLTQGYPSLKISYIAAGRNKWAGVMWQNPPNNWGRMDGGYNLTEAKKVSFCAKGEKGGEVIEFIIGGLLSSYPDSTNLTTGEIALNEEWTIYIIDLSLAKLDYISGGFCFILSKESNPKGCTFYLDDIKYDK